MNLSASKGILVLLSALALAAGACSSEETAGDSGVGLPSGPSTTRDDGDAQGDPRAPDEVDGTSDGDEDASLIDPVDAIDPVPDGGVADVPVDDVASTDVVCEPDCEGKQCGDDGCGGECGTCPEALPFCSVDGVCAEPCEPDCNAKNCGDDGCGGVCGTCPVALPVCNEQGVCMADCAPACEGKECGDDGCGGLCGSCFGDKPLCGLTGLCEALPDEDPPDDPLEESDCPPSAEFIYLVSTGNHFLKFDPQISFAEEVGILACPAAGASPFSMAIDRFGVAWVLYSNGTLWNVDVQTLECSTTPYVGGQAGFEYFGMGFAGDGPATDEETLYIAGGSQALWGWTNAALGAIDQDTYTTTSLSTFQVGPGSPELTGTRSGELWGFFPTLSPPRVAQIDKNTAELLVTHNLDPGIFGNVQAWAFAQWAGQFYVFYRSQFDPGTQVWRVDGQTGATVQVIEDIGYVIVGAGVSTCAPIE